MTGIRENYANFGLWMMTNAKIGCVIAKKKSLDPIRLSLLTLFKTIFDDITILKD